MGNGIFQYGFPIIWFCYAVVTLWEYRQGRSGLGAYLNVDRTDNPKLFWFFLTLNLVIIGFGTYVFVDGTVNGWQ